ncbi:hypothetical protein PC113_g15428 [Phytophthora cactorum]|uniref:Crinkler effector protein N-terminal domain-containing protein n=2 Tax=Phytophthora cactorum TaxID=29920 RepID=A0A8T0YQP0_9STRA|nr:hypothetical protein PC113_g15428 [Phytophthora cactorum]
MVEISLECAIVGQAGTFDVTTDDGKKVSVLKDAIKGKNPATITCDVKDLQLFLAKTADGAWLSSPSEDVKKLKKGEKTALIKALTKEDQELQAEDPLEDVLFGMDPPSARQIHVLVVVPEQWTSALIVSKDGVFDHCIHPFFSQFPTVDQVGDWLEFPALLPLTERQKLYVRCSYKSIAAQALTKVDPNRRKYAVITGTPGIGKSVFVYYVMWRLIKDKMRVLFITRQPPIYFDGSTIHECKQLPYSGNQQFWSPDLWCLVDSVDPTNVAGMPIECCSVLLASTPRRDCIGEFKKLVPTPDVFYMPLWTTEELATIAPIHWN